LDLAAKKESDVGADDFGESIAIIAFAFASLVVESDLGNALAGIACGVDGTPPYRNRF